MPKTKPLPRNAIIILADLVRARRKLTIRQVSERTGMAWQTISSNIKKLRRRRLIKIKRLKNRTYVEASDSARRSLGY